MPRSKKKLSTQLLEPSPETIQIMTLRQLIKDNNLLPPEHQKDKYDLLIAAGYPETRARVLAGILVEGDKFTLIKNRGFDIPSGRLLISEIAHDTNVKPEVRLNAGKVILQVLGDFKENASPDGGASTILAQLLADMFKRSEDRPKIIEVQNGRAE